MSTAAWWAALACGSTAALATVWLRARRRTGALRERLTASANDLEHLQQAFARFAPPEVVDRIAARAGVVAGEKREVTVLFADLVGFTALSESLPPEVLVRVLSEHFHRMSGIVTEHRGHVAKFIGDGLMALFGALERNPWQCQDAVRAALAMQRAVADGNAARAARALPPLRLGIGIHHGVAVAGVVGSAELQEFTVIGSTVNLASRVERLTRELGAGVLVTAAVRAHLDGRFAVSELPPVAVRGVEQPVVTFRVESFAGETDGASM